MQTRNQTKKSMDPTLFMGYFPDDEPLERIEERFRLLEEKEKLNVTGKSEYELAKSTFIETALPENFPNINLWYKLETIEEDENDYFYNDEASMDWGDEVIRPSKSLTRSKSYSKSNSGKEEAVNTNFTNVDQLGSGFELWPNFKLNSILRIRDTVFEHQEFPNEQVCMGYDEFLEFLSSTKIHKVKFINIKTISEVIKNVTKNKRDISNTDCVLMDPPFGSPNFDKKRFATLMNDFKNKMGQSFIFIWCDPAYFALIASVATEVDFKFCDSVCCELLNPNGEPCVAGTTEEGLKYTSRMLLLYRNFDVQKNDLAQQRVKDTGWGICAPYTKTFGRASMPLIAHNIIEYMLPQRNSGRRIFIELWPSEFARRENWIQIDEIEDD